jgi:Domain of unknown function (DUF3303)
VLFMIVERFADGDPRPVYRRLRDEGRGVPDGLRYVDSWVDATCGRCFQLMECDDLRLMQAWALHWTGYAELEIVPVVHASETRALVEAAL